MSRVHHIQHLLLLVICYFLRGQCRSVLRATARAYAHASSNNNSSSISNNNNNNNSNNTTSKDVLSTLEWIPHEAIRIVRFIDSGRFSNVFECRVACNKNVLEGKEGDAATTTTTTPKVIDAVVKVLKPTFAAKIKRELRILLEMRGVQGIIKLLGATKNAGCFPKTISLVFESLGPHAHWLSSKSCATPLSREEICLFTYKLLLALKECHKRGVMHRDIKPRNVLCDLKSKQLRIIDFGLSELYVPERRYNPSVASRHYKSPELLFGYLYYSYAVDMWSTGCLFASLIFDKEPFFFGADMNDQISCVASVVGSKCLLQWANKYHLKFSPAMRKAIGDHPKTPLSEFLTEKNAHLCSPEAIDLASKMLCVDHQERWTVDECLAHPYFDSVRDQNAS